MPSPSAPLPDAALLGPLFAELQAQGGDADRIGFVREQLTFAFQAATTKAKEFAEEESRLATEREELRRTRHNLESEQSRLQEEQKKLSEAATALLQFPEEFRKLRKDTVAAEDVNGVKGEVTTLGTHVEALRNQLETIGLDKKLKEILSKEDIGILFNTQLDKIDDTTKDVASSAAQAVLEGSSSTLTASLPKLIDLQQWSESIESSRLEAVNSAVSKSMSAALTQFQESEIRGYQVTIGALESTIEREKTTREALENEIATLRERQETVQDLKNEVAAKDRRVRELSESLADLNAQLTESEQASRSHEQKALALQKEVDAKGQQLTEMKSQLRCLDESLTERSSQLTESKQASHGHEQRALALQKEADSKGQQLTEINSQVKDLAQSLVESNTRLTEIRRTSETHEDKARALEKDVEAKDGELADMHTRLRELENRPEPTPETPPEEQEIASELGKMYVRLAHECSSIPTARGSSYTFHMRTLALTIAPLMLSPNARLHLLSLLGKEMRVWRCLDEVSYMGASAEGSQERVCRQHSGKCVLVRVIEIEGREVLDFYLERQTQ